MKGIAVDKIILLLLGVIVLAIIGYLLYTTFMGPGSQVSRESCKAALLSACTQCKFNAWTKTVTVSGKMCNSGFIYEILGISVTADQNSGNFNLACSGNNGIQDPCKNNLGIQ